MPCIGNITAILSIFYFIRWQKYRGRKSLGMNIDIDYIVQLFYYNHVIGMGNAHTSTASFAMDLSKYPLPETVLVHILSFVDGKDLLLKCSCVCQTWKRLIDSQTLWRTKCERAGFYSTDLLPSPPDDFKKYFFQNPYNRNLIKNPCALGNFYIYIYIFFFFFCLRLGQWAGFLLIIQC